MSAVFRGHKMYKYEKRYVNFFKSIYDFRQSVENSAWVSEQEFTSSRGGAFLRKNL